jgi:gas vesicle protein
MGGKSKAPAPDPQIGAASKEMAAIARDQFEYSKTRDAEMDALYDEYMPIVRENIEASTAQAQKQTELTDWYQSRMQSVFAPIEDKLAGWANDGYQASAGVQQEMEQGAGRAKASVDQQFGSQREQQARSALRYGVRPTDGAFLAADNESRLAQAGAAAAGMTNAREGVKTLDWARNIDAASLGRNLPGNQATSAQIALGAQGQAQGAMGNAMGQFNQNTGTTLGGMSSAVGSMGQSGQLALSNYNAQLSAWQANQQASAAPWSAIGSLAGAALGSEGFWTLAAKSSKDLKTNKAPARSALHKLRKLPVEEWTYKDGVADEGRHVGPYAEDVQREFGDQAAPGGKAIDLISMNGITMKAVQELADEVESLKGKKGGGKRSLRDHLGARAGEAAEVPPYQPKQLTLAVMLKDDGRPLVSHTGYARRDGAKIMGVE